MIIDVKFRWTLAFTLKGKRKPEDARISDVAPVEVRSISGDEAPAAFRYQGVERSDWEGQTIDVRSFEGRLWQPKAVVDYDGRKTVAALTLEEFQAKLLADDRAVGTPFQLHDAYSDYRTSTTLDHIGSCKLEADYEEKRSAVVQQLQRLALDLLIVDGVVHEPACEPVYVIKAWGHGDEYGDIEIEFASDIDAETAPNRVFRSDRPEEVAAEAVAMGFETPVTEIKPEYRIEVLIPELVTFQYDMASRLRKQAQRICDGMVSDLKDADLSFAATYIQLRDALFANDLDKVAGIVTNDLIPVLEPKSQLIGFRTWNEESARELREEWLRFGGDVTLPSDHELVGLAG
ncbi:hypothetical protein ACVIGB_000084 [Bradyrhizobium sp. USDA 4341]